MKKIVLIILTLFLTLLNVDSLNATTGLLKNASIIECDGKLYGTHGNDNHYHIAEKVTEGKYKAVGDSLGTNWTCKGNLKDPNDERILEKVKATFDSCVDGDTANFIINSEKVKFRFLAIDTPETVHPTKGSEAYGKNASEFTCNKLTNGNLIEIEYEDNKLDKYGRSLGWIWVDGTLLQEELVSIGYAEVAYIYGSYKYTSKLCEVEKDAIQNNLGMWSDSKKEEGYCSTLRKVDKTGTETSQKIENEENKSENIPIKYGTGVSILIIIIGIIIKIMKK